MGVIPRAEMGCGAQDLCRTLSSRYADVAKSHDAEYLDVGAVLAGAPHLTDALDDMLLGDDDEEANMKRPGDGGAGGAEGGSPPPHPTPTTSGGTQGPI